MCEQTETLVASFAAQLDGDELALLLHTLRTMKKAKSQSASTRRWREFERWFRERRGL